MSSSHLFLGLPIDLLVLYFELSSGFHSAALINHLSFCDVAILIASLHFIFCESCSSIESLHFPSFPWHRLCFFMLPPTPVSREGVWVWGGSNPPPKPQTSFRFWRVVKKQTGN